MRFLTSIYTLAFFAIHPPGRGDVSQDPPQARQTPVAMRCNGRSAASRTPNFRPPQNIISHPSSLIIPTKEVCRG